MTYYLYMYSFPSQGILQLRIPNPMGEPRPVAAIRENTFVSPFRADSQRTTFTPVVNGSPLQFSCKRLASRTVINPLRSWETQVEHIWQITRVLQGQRQVTYTLHHNRGTNRFTDTFAVGSIRPSRPFNGWTKLALARGFECIVDCDLYSRRDTLPVPYGISDEVRTDEFQIRIKSYEFMLATARTRIINQDKFGQARRTRTPIEGKIKAGRRRSECRREGIWRYVPLSFRPVKDGSSRARCEHSSEPSRHFRRTARLYSGPNLSPGVDIDYKEPDADDAEIEVVEAQPRQEGKTNDFYITPGWVYPVPWVNPQNQSIRGLGPGGAEGENLRNLRAKH
ncbi:hypothetical protein B0H13DRAFT_1905795 [Mycena leptocephala]|nr:hypothetical protein B0H13DRAFT_1905795 [Mycena leptocephala]